MAAILGRTSAPAMPTVFRADASHIDALAPLFDGYRQFYRQPADLDGARRFLSSRLAADESVILAASLPELDGLAGFTQLYPFFSSVRMCRVWVLNDLFVTPDARRRGVARALMDAAHAFAREAGATDVWLETEKTNTQAQALYNDLGYRREEATWHYTLTL